MQGLLTCVYIALAGPLTATNGSLDMSCRHTAACMSCSAASKHVNPPTHVGLPGVWLRERL